MLDQSFSAENFRIILDLENRKGIHVEDKLSLFSIKKLNEEIRDCNLEIKVSRKLGSLQRVKDLIQKKKEIRAKKEDQLKIELEKISQKISEKLFRIEIKKVEIPNQKPIYTTLNTPENYFALKQIQYNVSKLFGVKQSNRFAIVEQVKILLEDKLPKFVIRTDIKDFYESIQHEKLLARINRDNLLTPFSRKILQGILLKYRDLSGTDKGIPRGIGVSAHLAELFMRDIDKKIKAMQDIIYYARYVDDIIVMFVPRPTESNRNYIEELKNIVEIQNQLILNPNKTFSYDLRGTSSLYQVDYLGYKVSFGDGKVKTRLTDKKIDRYKERIRMTFDEYLNLSKIDEKRARKLLVKRIRFLCGNTKLVNNKKNILVGIFYSNRHLNQLDDLLRLDNSLDTHINLKITSQHLVERLKKYSFLKGFQEKSFSVFKTSELNEIVKLWANNR